MRLKIQPDYTRFVNINRYFSMDNMNVFILTGGRGIGKTTGLNIHDLQEYMNKGNEFVYIRRYKTEIIKAKTMLDPLCDGILDMNFTEVLLFGRETTEDERTKLKELWYGKEKK